jgi:hypothetical protein
MASGFIQDRSKVELNVGKEISFVWALVNQSKRQDRNKIGLKNPVPHPAIQYFRGQSKSL